MVLFILHGGAVGACGPSILIYHTVKVSKVLILYASIFLHRRNRNVIHPGRLQSSPYTSSLILLFSLNSQYQKLFGFPRTTPQSSPPFNPYVKSNPMVYFIPEVTLSGVGHLNRRSKVYPPLDQRLVSDACLVSKRAQGEAHPLGRITGRLKSPLDKLSLHRISRPPI
jgi:hypothetical protein